LNAAYRVLICTACRQAVRPRILARHLRRSHGIVGRIGKQVRKYVEGFPWDYTHSTAPWPGDGSEAQAVLAVIAGYECSRCEGGPEPFRTSSEQCWTRHGFATHGLSWADASKTPPTVLMQSWFLAGRQRYWRIRGTAGAEPGDPANVEEKRGMADAGTGRENTIAMGQVPARERKRKRGAADVGEGEGRRERSQREPSIEEPTTATPPTTTTDRRVRANSGQRRASTARDDGRPARQVQFAAGQVEIDGLEGLKQQLERWSHECVVCYLVGRAESSQGRPHTIWECRQEVAEEVRADSREMEARIGAVVAAEAGCAGCQVPATMCERWQWGVRREESTGRCQYAGVMISTMMAMAVLGQAAGVRQVGIWLRRAGVDPRGPEEKVSRWFGKAIWWEGVEAGQVVWVFMMLARMNGALRGRGEG
jgi:hypothetical protein